MSLSNLKIGAKLAIAFGTAFMLLALLVGFASQRTDSVYRVAQELATVWMPASSKLAEIQAVLGDIRRAELQHVMSFDAAELSEHEARLARNRKALDASIAELQGLMPMSAGQQPLTELKEEVAKFWDVDGRLLVLSRKGEASFAESKVFLRGDSRTAFNRITSLVEKQFAANVEGGKGAEAKAAETQRLANIYMAAFLGFSLVVFVAISSLVTRAIRAPILQAVRAAERVAAGDLSNPISVAVGKDEPAQLLRALSG
ncbi:MAG: chemotaxis protein, partial [Rhizobacter sp.]|nr:chemotaxis protein [Rhizobacter sp.]